MVEFKNRRFWSVKLQVHSELMQTYWPLRKEGIEMTNYDIWSETTRIMEDMDNEERKYYTEIVNRMKQESSQLKQIIVEERLRARCSPSAVVDTLEMMSPDQQQAIEQMGFGKVFQLELKEWNRFELSEALECFNPVTMMFSVDGAIDVELTATSIGKMMGFVEENRHKSVPIKLKRCVDLGIQQSECSIQQLKSYICDHRHSAASPEWRQRVVLYLLTVFYAPTSRFNPTRELVVAATAYRQPTKYAWSQYILDHLKKWVSLYKDSKEKTMQKERNLGGCLYILVVLLRAEKKKSKITTQEMGRQKPSPKREAKLIPEQVMKPMPSICLKNKNLKTLYEEVAAKLRDAAREASTIFAERTNKIMEEMFVVLEGTSKSLSDFKGNEQKKPEGVETYAKSRTNINIVYQQDRTHRPKTVFLPPKPVPIEYDSLSSTAADQHNHIQEEGQNMQDEKQNIHEEQRNNDDEKHNLNEWAIVVSQDPSSELKISDEHIEKLKNSDENIEELKISDKHVEEIDKFIEDIQQKCDYNRGKLELALTQHESQKRNYYEEFLLTPAEVQDKKRKRRTVSQIYDEYYFSPQLKILVSKYVDLLWEFLLSNRRKERYADKLLQLTYYDSLYITRGDLIQYFDDGKELELSIVQYAARHILNDDHSGNNGRLDDESPQLSTHIAHPHVTAICYTQLFPAKMKEPVYNEEYARNFAWDDRVPYDVTIMQQILIPILNNDDWWLVACDLNSGICTIFDSLGNLDTPEKIERVKYTQEHVRLAQCWLLSKGRSVNFNLEEMVMYHKEPLQPDSFSYDLYVIRHLELWRGGKLPVEELRYSPLQMRKAYLEKWVFDPHNKHRNKIKAGLARMKKRKQCASTRIR